MYNDGLTDSLPSSFRDFLMIAVTFFLILIVPLGHIDFFDGESVISSFNTKVVPWILFLEIASNFNSVRAMVEGLPVYGCS